MSDTDTTPAYRLTREDYLHRATDILRPMFEQVGAKLPDVIHLSVGFGGSGAGKYERFVEGVTWFTAADACGHNHVFISPTLGDTAHVLEVLVHELCHVADNNKSGHKGAFAETMTRLGMTGAMTTAQADIPFMAELMVIAAELGEYPHGALDMGVTVPTDERVKVGPDGAPIIGRPSSGPKAQTNRWIHVHCPEHGGTVRLSRTALDQGAPLCGREVGTDLLPGVCATRMIER